ncbi:Hpt domain-containing protein [Cyanobacterium sp. DS4]|uniref:Hpt domain-containing protein n=1 Tax=Cyanobacterium sp. DS4 TaxID=2878255 RepID=UPI002E7FBCBC|nr:Hpt domain-containing protein [Cyanobacterium sp. Dongsha4]WVK99519.1 Hpt domain-containing protein [Cyanobacterium sp. Dongsha4]
MNSLNQAYQLFIDEVPELLQEIENGLLNLNHDRRVAVIHGMMRAAHSLKGGAASVGLQGIKNIAHRLEDYLKALYNEDLIIDTELEDLFLEAFDSLAVPLKQQLENGDFDRTSAQNKAEEVWQKLDAKLGNAIQQVKDYLPSSEDLGIDIVASMFEVDIAQEIRRLKGVVASPESFNPSQELRESLEILQGLGEVVNLPGFSLIVSMTQQAFEKHPDKTIIIAGLLVQDLEESREIVLGGDRISGGNPCSNLLALAEDNQAQVEAKVLHKIAQTQQNTVSVEDPVYQFFMAEVPDLLHEIEAGLLSLKEDKSINNINNIMRSAHSLKGGAASVGLDNIKDMAHKLEDYIKALFDESVIVNDELETLFLSGFDCLKNALEEQKSDGNYSLQWQDEAEAVWQQLENKLGDIDNSNYLPSSADLGVDIVESLFEIDIARIIEQLQENLETCTTEELKISVTPVLEVLIGFSEIGNMKGLKSIVDTTFAALTENPHKIKQIVKYLINDLIQARDDVLSGNSTQGGKPSPELEKLAHNAPEDLEELVEGDNLFHPDSENSEDSSLLDFADLASEINSNFDQEGEENIFDVSVDNYEFNFTPENDHQEELPDLSNLIQENHTEDIFANFSSESNQEENYPDLDIFMDNIFGEDNQEDDSISIQQKELQAQSYKFFMEEAVELIALIDNNLETVFQTRDINDINEVARAAHSLKGGSRSAGLEEIGMIALRVEKSLKALFNDDIPLDEARKIYLRDIYQTLRQAIVARMENQEFDEKSAMDRVNAQWEVFESEYGEEIAKSEEFLPSSSDLGIDIATSIFEVDVPEGIANLQQALDSGNANDLQDTLLMQIEVFSGFGEMLGLPGFTAICETANKALNNNPNQIVSITQAFIDNLQEAHHLVIEGDRTSGGEPSTDLLVLAGESAITPSEEISTAVSESTEKPIDTSDQAYGFFIEEAPELLQTIETGLLNLREERTTAKIHEMMRAAHSIKGGAASVGLEAIKTISHELEDIFKVLYNPDIDIDTDLESWLLEGFDCLQNALTTQMETGTYQPQESLEEASQIWAKIRTKLGAYLDRADDYIPSSSDLGVDIVQSMFEVDVEQELQRLKNVLENPSSQPLGGELRATLEVFCGFGEMLNLPGFAEIAQLGLQAAETNPDHILTIINVIIRDAEKARDVVLGGDRTRGGEPSEELKRLAQGDNNLEAEDNIFFLDNSDDITEDEPSLNEVFGEVLSTPEEIFPAIDKDTHTTIPPLEDVFQLDFDPSQLEALDQGIADNDDDETPNLEEIFASEFSEEEINLLANASELALENDKNNTIPSLDDVFVADDSNLVNTPEESEDSPLPLDDVFANPDFSLIEADEESEEEDILSLSEIFSNVELPLENNLVEVDQVEESTTPEEVIAQDQNTINDQPEDIFTLPPEDEESSHVSTTEQNSTDEEEKQPIEAKTPKETHKQTIINLSPEEREVLLSAKGENIEQTIQSIADIYDKLPGLKSSEQIKGISKKEESSSEKTSITPASTAKPATPSPKSNLTIRVDLDRLERMNNLMGELSINRNGLSLQNNKLQNAVKELIERFANFQQMANNLRDLSDKMLVSPEKFAPRGQVNANNNFSLASLTSEDDDLSLHSAFDALEMDRYDNLYNLTQGLIEQMIQLEEAVDDIGLFASQSGQTVENQRQMLNRLRDELMWARMLPLGEILNRFPRVLRDLSVKYNKKVNLKLSGTSVLVDKAALEKLYDPLVHLIRNAFDHGIETPELRKQRNKPDVGTIEVKAYHQGNQTIIEIRDDGGGLNLQKIGQKAVEKQLITSEQLAVITKENLLDLIFEPGFSTASAVTEISGRGVGLDIVRSQLRSLKGTISVDSEPNVGTTFILRLPLTLTIDKLLVLSAGVHFYALPSDNIVEIVVPEDEQIKISGNKRFLHYEHRVVPIYPLTDLLEYRCYLSNTASVNQSLEILPTPEEWGKPLLLINLGQELFAMEVDHLVSEQELVIKPFGKALTAPSYTYGCTILGDGTLIPVINTTILLANYLQVSSGGTVAPRRVASSTDNVVQSQSFQVSSVLVVDDSAAMRRTLALSLEKAGYRVVQAKDGKDAIEQLQQGLSVNLIICDIEMPNMNGFEFLGQRRRYPEFNKVPVAMLTSRSNDKHRKLATHLGANAYFTKPYIEQKFLESIRNLVEGQKSAVTA